MNYLLKMVEGPMKGAEIALVPGTRVKVGSADACDVVVADASLPDVAFELDVTDSAVTLILPDGDAKTMHPFEIQAFGTTEVAVGPAEGTWEPLTRPAPPAPDAPVETPAEEAAEKPAEEAAEAPAEEPSAAPEGDARQEPAKKGHGLLVVGVLAFLATLLLAAAIAALWFWPHVRPLATKVSAKAAAVDVWADRLGSLRAKCFSGKDVVAEARAEQKLTLGELAGQNGLALDRKDGRPLLKGNLKLRTERLAVRALALACDRTCLFDLTDDESLRASADSLLFLVTEGAIQVASLTNRVASLKGFAPLPADLSTAVRALIADVPGIEKIVTSGVKTGNGSVSAARKRGKPSMLDAKAPPATETDSPRLASAAVRKPAGGPPAANVAPQRDAEVVFQTAASNAMAVAAAAASNAVAAVTAAASNVVREVNAERRALAKKAEVLARVQNEGGYERKAPNGTFLGLPPGKSPRDYPPIAGILTMPYPCVVLANGMRCVYGAHIGGSEIVSIEADSLTLIDDGVEFVWVP